MLEIILITVVWRRGWGAWALVPTASLFFVSFLAGATGLLTAADQSFVVVLALIEYAILIAMALNPREKDHPVVSERTEAV